MTNEEINSRYPELAKAAHVAEETQIIGDFMDWLESQKCIVLAEPSHDYGSDQLMPTWKSADQLLAEYFGVDLKKLEEEKVAILKEIEEVAK